MAHNLTDLDAFTSPIVVPDGSDSRNDAAERVEAIAQALGDRTNYLKLRTAFLALANVFTNDNEFQGTLDVSGMITATGIEINNPDSGVAAIVTRTTADDDSHAGNLWKAVEGYKLGGAVGYVNIYTGTGSGGEGQFIITLNAAWDTAAQRWGKDAPALAAFAMIFTLAGTVSLSRKDGAGTWTAWPSATSTASNLAAGSGSFASLVSTNGLFSPSGTATVQDVAASNDVTADHALVVPMPTDGDESMGVNYSDAAWRTLMIPLFDALGATPYQNLYADGILAVYQPTITGVGDMVGWPITVPPGCQIGEIRVRHVQSSTVVGGNDEFLLLKRTGLTGAWGALDSVTAAGAGGAAQTTAVNSGGAETVTDGTEYMLRWIEHNTDLTASVHRVQGIEIDVFDIGPRNKVN